MNQDQNRLLIKKLRKRIRQNNWDYLCRHPEVRACLRVILNEVVKEQPDEIYGFTANMFNCFNIEKIAQEVNEQMKRLNNLKESSWNEYEGDMIFNDGPESSDHSLKSGYSTIINLLKFSGFGNESTSESSEGKSEFINLPHFR